MAYDTLGAKAIWRDLDELGGTNSPWQIYKRSSRPCVYGRDALLVYTMHESQLSVCQNSISWTRVNGSIENIYNRFLSHKVISLFIIRYT